MAYSNQAASPSPSSSFMSHYRAPSTSNPTAGIGAGMSRGLSHDGVTMLNAGNSARAPPPTLQTNSLLPTSYAPNSGGSGGSGGGRPLSYAGGYTPMSGVQQDSTSSSTSPRMQPPPSPSRYNSTSAVPPPPMSSQYSGASSSSSSASFYPQHIAQAYGSAPQQQLQQLSNSTSASTSTSSLSLSPHLNAHGHPPPPQSVSPQQYYQSQQYLDHAMRQSTQAGGASSQSSPSTTHAPAGASLNYHHQSSYGGGHSDMRSLSLNSSSTLHSPNLSGGGAGFPHPSSPSTFDRSASHPRKKGLKKVRDVNEIERKNNVQPRGRRADPAGGFISVSLERATDHIGGTDVLHELYSR